MRYFKWLCFVLLCSNGNAQSLRDTILLGKQYLYHGHSDTIQLSPIYIGQFTFCNSKIIDSLQIDGEGTKELIFFRKCSGAFDDHGGTFDINDNTAIEKYEIWNIDSKELIFEAIVKIDYQCKNSIYGIGMRGQRITGDTKYSFSASFSIDLTGTIEMKNINRTCVGDNCSENSILSLPYNLPEPNPGYYKFVDGRYQ
jgi:hypothetical protein